MSTKFEEGYTFNPSLQDISLKRFRLRYCAVNDCYYLHWDNAVCPPLARIEGFMNGLHSASGVRRQFDEAERKAYLSCDDGVQVGKVQWKIDFSGCGLVISRVEVKAKWMEFGEEGEESIQFTVVGDNRVICAPYLEERAVEIPEVVGCHAITLMASLHQPTDMTDSPQLLLGEADRPGDCPLDIIIDLMCPRHEHLSFVGELLLGLKFTEEDSPPEADEVDKHDGDVPVIREKRRGQLQVHVVEGAGIFDEETRKPFNAVVKCELLPDTGRYSVKQTSPRHNAYPTWAKEFIYADLTRQDLLQGGLEVLVYDHHHILSDSIVGGLRLSVPQKNNRYKSDSFSSDSPSPVRSQSNSPGPTEININGGSPVNGWELSPSPHHVNLSSSHPRLGSRHSGTKTLPSCYSPTTLSPTPHSPLPLRRAPSPSPRSSPNTLSPILRRRALSPSPKTSPIIAAKNLFRLSGSHLRELVSPHTSPCSSPIPSRRKTWRFGSRSNSMESEFIFWWMEDTTVTESNHWKQMLDRKGEWVYSWHVLQPKLKPAYS